MTKPTTEDLEKNDLYRQLLEENERLKAELSEKATITTVTSGWKEGSCTTCI